MAPTPEETRESVLRAIDEYNSAEQRAVPRSLDTVLLGAGGAVDSLGLVRLIMTVERRVEDDFGVAVSLTDEKAMSQRNSPFRTVGTLVDYLTACLGPRS
jgi:acyl carrier protein